MLWLSPTTSHIGLGNTMPAGQTNDSSRAFGISNPDQNGTVYVVGANTTANVALLWQRDASGAVSVKDLNSAVRCGDTELKVAHDVNDSGAIVASGKIAGEHPDRDRDDGAELPLGLADLPQHDGERHLRRPGQLPVLDAALLPVPLPHAPMLLPARVPRARPVGRQPLAVLSAPAGSLPCLRMRMDFNP